MSRSRRHMNGISHSGNSELITRVRSSSLIAFTTEVVGSIPRQARRPERRSAWTLVIKFS